MLLSGGDCFLFFQSVWTSGRKWHSRKVLNKRKMLVSQWKQEVVAWVLYSLEESKRQRENSLNRSGRSRREKCRSTGGVGRAEERGRRHGDWAIRPTAWETLNLLVGLDVLKRLMGLCSKNGVMK